MPKAGLTLANIQKIDRSGMLGLLLDFPDQCLGAEEIGRTAAIGFQRRDFRSIIFAGLGGSAIGGDLVRSLLSAEIGVPVSVVRDYELPACVDNSTLVFILSYSGSTEETVSAYASAKAQGATIIVISSGGAVRDLARQDGHTFIAIPAGMPPRCALGYLSLVPLCVLNRLGLCKDVSAGIKDAIRTLTGLRNDCIGPRVAGADNIAKSAANALYNKFTVIYSSAAHFDVAAARWRAQISENAKALASLHLFPEMNHNEIVGWERPQRLFKDFAVVMLKDRLMHPRVLKRMEIAQEIIRKEGVRILEVWSRGESLLARILSLTYIGDFVSFYLAILYGCDPTPVERIAYLKARLAQR